MIKAIIDFILYKVIGFCKHEYKLYQKVTAKNYIGSCKYVLSTTFVYQCTKCNNVHKKVINVRDDTTVNIKEYK